MKKKIILPKFKNAMIIGALALAGMYASCQKKDMHHRKI
jgi:hypothetical protein